MAMSPPSSSFDLKLLLLLPLILLYLVLPSMRCRPLEHPGCLAGSWHKRHPSPEPALPACRNYTKKSCCTPQETSVFVTSPISHVDPISWDRCGNLSLRCEGYFKRVECFNRCSPMAIQWAHPAHPGLLHHTPLCLDFCNGWFHSCAEDLTCVRNWIYDWDWNIEGNLCPGPCTPFKQFGDGDMKMSSVQPTDRATDRSSIHNRPIIHPCTFVSVIFQKPCNI
uniref:Zgc:109949 n=1 Tax=Eptatretus burgeri TaxID=7764 RepID=A0A8C4Q0C0_EPTBU